MYKMMENFNRWSEKFATVDVICCLLFLNVIEFVSFYFDPIELYCIAAFTAPLSWFSAGCERKFVAASGPGNRSPSFLYFRLFSLFAAAVYLFFLILFPSGGVAVSWI